MNHDRRLIEDSLPLEAISAQSAREKSIRHGHISTLHIWWARRPLAAMRAAIFASLIPAPETDEERDYLHALIADIVDWDHVKHGNSPRIEEAKELIQKYYPDAPPKVLDPFMGGGSTGLEALRLGCEAHGVELNPVAYLIELCTLVYPQKYGQPVEVSAGDLRSPEQSELPGMETDKQLTLDLPEGETRLIQNPLAEDVRRWGEWVLEEARKEIGHLYEDPEGRTIVGYIWARTARCPNPACGAEMPMVRQWWLAKKGNRKVAMRPVVNTKNKTIELEIVQGDEIDFDPSEGTMRQGNIRCLICGQPPSQDYLRDEGLANRLGLMPLVVIYDTPGQAGKGYRPSAESDWSQYLNAQRHLDGIAQTNPEILPTERIPTTELRRVAAPLYGLDSWDSLFNARQTLSLVTFTLKLNDAYEQLLKETQDIDYSLAVITFLALVVDRLADYNSTLCNWHNTGEKIGHTFARQALGMVWDYVEVNPLSGATGDWQGALDWVVQVIEHCSLSSLHPALISQGTATRLQLNVNYFDAIITDPPYYDSVPYSHLADFFYVWLKRTIGHLYPMLFQTPLTPKSSEIVQDRPHSLSNSSKDAAFYEIQMTKAFLESSRVLHNNGIFTVVFAHKSTSAWETLINSLLESNLVVTASWPLHTEMATRLRAMGTASLASSIFIVCRKRVAETEGFFDDVQAELRQRINERLNFFWSQGIRGADFFISAIGPAVEVFGRYSQVRKLSGEVVGVAELLDLVQEAVADYALGQIMNGRYRMGMVDAPTRFYVMYRWSYGSEKQPFDDSRRLAQALGAEVDDLIHRHGLLKQSGENVTLLGPLQREQIERLGESGRDGSTAPLIDVVQRAAILWRSGDRQALANFISTHALGREDGLRSVAQALVNVLPDGDKERQLLEGFLAGQDGLPPSEYGRAQRLPGME